MNKKTSMLFFALSLITACGSPSSNGSSINYRNEMRSFVIGISEYAKVINAGFIVIPQNGGELLSLDGEAGGSAATDYISAIDGIGREDLYYGYDNDNVATNASDTAYMKGFTDIALTNGKTVLVTDYCSTQTNMDDSYTKNNTAGYISFAADHRSLDDIPSYPASPYNGNTNAIPSLSSAKNFLYLINPALYSDKTTFINALDATNYDVILIDLFFNNTALTSSDIAPLKTKPGGQARLVICYMSIGEAEDYRYYWKSSWSTVKPAWLDAANPDWAGNYKVKYWNSDWQKIIYGNDASYVKKILDAGFNGVYLDIIDAFEYYENQ